MIDRQGNPINILPGQRVINIPLECIYHGMPNTIVIPSPPLPNRSLQNPGKCFKSLKLIMYLDTHTNLSLVPIFFTPMQICPNTEYN